MQSHCACQASVADWVTMYPFRVFRGAYRHEVPNQGVQRTIQGPSHSTRIHCRRCCAGYMCHQRPSWIAKCTVIGLSIATAMSPSLRRLPSGPDATATVKRSPWACSLRRRCPRANVKTRSWLPSVEDCSSHPAWVVG